MADEKQNKSWMIIFWAVFALAVIGGVGYFAWNGDKVATTTTKTTDTGTCTKKVADGTAADVDKIGPNEVKITADNFDQEVVQAKGVVLVDAYAPWCPHCQRISTTINELANDYKGKAIVGKMNANNQDTAMKANFDFAVKNGLQGYPTVWIYKDGKIVDSFSGEKTYCEIKALLDKQL